jgi:hypothetical protein
VIAFYDWPEDIPMKERTALAVALEPIIRKRMEVLNGNY